MSKIAVGKVGKTFGQSGDVVVGLYEAFDSAAEVVLRGLNAEGGSGLGIDNQEPLHVVFDGLEVPVFIDRFDRRGRAGALVRFADIDTPRRAEMLVGKELFFGGSLTDQGEDLADIVGWQAEMWVSNEPDDSTDDVGGAGSKTMERGVKSPICGTVTAVFDATMNPLLQVEIDTSISSRGIAGDGVGEKDEVLLPVAFVVKVDDKAKKITLRLPEGLLELNK